MNNIFFRDDVTISVSYDFDCREKHEQVLQNMLLFSKDIHVLVLASECILSHDVNKMVSVFNRIKNVQSVEIKPYSPNQSNQQPIKYDQFEEFVKQWITADKDFLFINEQNIQKSLNKQYNSYSDNHIYILPSGKFAVLEFDNNDNEYFFEIDNLTQYLDWTDGEKQRIQSCKICSQCKFIGHCLSEHLRRVDTLQHSCNGFYKLLDYYERS